MILITYYNIGSVVFLLPIHIVYFVKIGILRYAKAQGRE